MKLLGFRPRRGKLKAYLIRKPEEIQNNQFGEVRSNCFSFARIVTPFSPLASRFRFDFSPLQQKRAARKHPLKSSHSVEVKDLVQIFGDGAIVRVRQHPILHVSPPAPARVRLRDPPPKLL